MAKVKQLTISLENQPGALARVAQVLADAKVNIVALLGSTSGTEGSAQVVVDNVSKAKNLCGAGVLEPGHIAVQEFPAFRSLPATVPRRGIQYSQPHQLPIGSGERRAQRK